MHLLQACCKEEDIIERIKKLQERHMSAKGKHNLQLLLEKHCARLETLWSRFDFK